MEEQGMTQYNESKENPSGLWFVVLVVLCALLLLNGCRTITQTEKEYVYRTDTLFEKVLQKDSIYVQDSIVIKQKGDTIYNDRWHTKYIEKTLHDTLYQSKVDSVFVEVEKIKQPTRREKLSIFFKGFFVGSLIALFVFISLKLLKWLAKIKANL